MNELCWIVLDDSGSLQSYDERIRRIHEELRDELECSFDVRSWTTSSSYGLGSLTARRIGSGGGDGLPSLVKELTHLNQPVTLRTQRPPSFVVYLTDDAVQLDRELVAALQSFHIVLVDITKWNPAETCDKLDKFYEFLLHECDDDCCDCLPGHLCECNIDGCLMSIEGGQQPFYPNWKNQTAGFLPSPSTMFQEEMTRYVGSGQAPFYAVGAFQALQQRAAIDADLNYMKATLAANKNRDITVRSQVGVQLHTKLKTLIANNTLEPVEWERVRTIRYLIYRECLNMTHDAAIKAANELHLKQNPNEVQEGQPMSAQISTTVSLSVMNAMRASVGDFKILIAEVERVGGTDESYVDMSRGWNGKLDTVVVTAVDVTGPQLDPRVEAILSIKDDDKRTRGLIDLLIDYPKLRDQITPHLTSSTEKTEAKPVKKTTAAKPKQ